mmetsp:Transcript_43825/g.88356  ORF Transcript_43825/g.88356 Transcript_43825/m.88356 type:complete len:279 (-) Transcript_43825:18-854(-)
MGRPRRDASGGRELPPPQPWRPGRRPSLAPRRPPTYAALGARAGPPMRQGNYGPQRRHSHHLAGWADLRVPPRWTVCEARGIEDQGELGAAAHADGGVGLSADARHGRILQLRPVVEEPEVRYVSLAEGHADDVALLEVLEGRADRPGGLAVADLGVQQLEALGVGDADVALRTQLVHLHLPVGGVLLDDCVRQRGAVAADGGPALLVLQDLNLAAPPADVYPGLRHSLLLPLLLRRRRTAAAQRGPHGAEARRRRRARVHARAPARLPPRPRCCVAP